MQAKGGKRGANGRGTMVNTGTRRRDECQRLVRGGGGRRPGRRSSAPGDEVGSGCDRGVLRQQTDIDGGR